MQVGWSEEDNMLCRRMLGVCVHCAMQRCIETGVAMVKLVQNLKAIQRCQHFVAANLVVLSGSAN